MTNQMQFETYLVVNAEDRFFTHLKVFYAIKGAQLKYA